MLKHKIPTALREQVWLSNFGEKFKHKCYINWCSNKITVFNFHAGHNIPESKGGQLLLENLRPICATCNTSMGNRYSIDEWQKLGKAKFSLCC
jgi:5-methylcytosine-specific restriction endonuclease McrA